MEAYGAEEWAACWVGASTARRARSGDPREPGAGSRGRRELRAGIGESLAGGVGTHRPRQLGAGRRRRTDGAAVS